MKSVIVSGAGPIGLMIACMLKKNNPEVNVLIYEKYSEYKRTHNLVVQYKLFKAFCEEANLMDEEHIKALGERIRQCAKIPTDELQRTLEGQARKLGVDIQIVQGGAGLSDDNFKTLVLDKNPAMIIGADGTKSYINQRFFGGKKNQEKSGAGYALQLRYNIKVNGSVSSLDYTNILRMAIRHGTTLNDFVGKENAGVIKATCPIMLSEPQFNNLRHLVSKNALQYASNPDKVTDDLVSQCLQEFIALKSDQLKHIGAEIIPESISVSVTEAPAVRSKSIYKIHGKTTVLLMGDAALGLSYFRGLNAGIAAVTQLAKSLPQLIQDNKDQGPETLEGYQKWFDTFSQERVDDMLFYYKTTILPLTVVSRALNRFLAAFLPGSILHPNHHTLKVYKLLRGDKSKVYQHRSFYPVVISADEIPAEHSLHHTKKIFVDLFSQFKSRKHLVMSLCMPFLAIYFIITAMRILVFSRSWRQVFDVAALLLRVCVMIAIYPISLTLFPIRFIRTLIHGPSYIQDNKGTKRLVARFKASTNDAEKIGICFDLYRKAKKGLLNGQASHVSSTCIAMAYRRFERSYLSQNHIVKTASTDLSQSMQSLVGMFTKT